MMTSHTMSGERYGVVLALALCCSLFGVTFSSSCQNLVPNSSFELADTCPYTIGFQEGDRPLNWFKWYNSPDYFHACAGTLQSIDTLVDVPQNGWTFQHAWDGSAYVGVYAYDGVLDEYREYVGAELLEPLVAGCDYRVRFRTNPAFDGSYWLPEGGGACNNIGLLFTTESNAWSGLTGPAFDFRNYAHLYSTAVVADTVAWTLVEGTYTADSAYAYVVLGNFFTDALTTGYANAGSWTDIAYYLIDSVSVTPIDATCHSVGFNEEGALAKPRLQWGAGGVEVKWDRTSFRATMTDMIGRPVLPEVVSRSGWLMVPRPCTAGAYLLELTAGEQTFVFKFVVM